ncbi:unnamed protein product [Miscanthus lutarioriparius]|uniref:DUF4219 domain-containing protein n=1 Tax=Miscanthus lutarioriparius TaxID=422564 RepID=A0A811PT58_9POAL|nr:unnamed protein product [Miscanthus lutarioriparius]
MGENGSSSGAERVRESSLMWLMLTRSNYAEWAMLLQCNFETLEIWDTIDPGGDKIAISIETLLDLKTLTIEELVGRLKMAEDRFGIKAVTDKIGNLLLSEEDWMAKYRHRLMPESSSTSGAGKKPWKPKHGGGGRRGDRGDRGEKKEPVIKLTSMGL